MTIKTTKQILMKPYQSVRFQELLTKLDAHIISDSENGEETVDGYTTESRTVKITPQLAQSLLMNNTKNRPFSNANLNKIIKAIESGEWKFNGHTITFDIDGTLLDGQHRLMAIIKTDKSLVIKVSTGYPQDVFSTIDNGKIRNGSDVLAIKGYDNYKSLNSTANYVYKYMRNGTAHRLNNKTLSNTELLAFVESEPALISSVEFYKELKKEEKTVIMKGYAVSGLHFLFSKKDVWQSKVFLRKLITGEDLTNDSPIFLLRDRLLDNKIYKRRMSQSDIFTLTIHAWNKYRAGETLNRLVTPRQRPIIK